jgi:hypothetical protein
MLMDRELPATPMRELATATHERRTLLDLSYRLSVPYDELLDRLWSSDVTRYVADTLIQRAQHEVDERLRTADAKRRKGRRR